MYNLYIANNRGYKNWYCELAMKIHLAIANTRILPVKALLMEHVLSCDDKKTHTIHMRHSA